MAFQYLTINSVTINLSIEWWSGPLQEYLMPTNVEDSTEVKAAGGADDNDDDEEDCELDLSGIDEDELGQKFFCSCS